MSTLIKRFSDYVKIASPSEHEEVFAKYLIKEASDMGFLPYQDHFGNIYIDIKGDDKLSEPILLNAHIDTVKHDKPIRPINKNGIITSNGQTILGADNKAGVAVIMEALQILKSQKQSFPSLQIIFTVQEEIGLNGAKKIKRDWIKPKIGFVLDGGEVDIVHHKAPAQCNLSAYVLGCAAHAGVHPEQGINAIKVASVAIAKMKLGRIDFETTSNIGIIEGGQATNIVPDKVFMKGEARSHSSAKLNAQVTNMESALKFACKKYNARLDLKVDRVYDSFALDKDDKVIRMAVAAMKEAGIKPKLVATGGGSDANIFNEIGIKCAILGVGADHVHTPSERIAVKDLERSVKYLLRIIRSNG